MTDSYKIIEYSGINLPEHLKPLVFSKWLRSLRYGNSLFKKIKSDAFYDNYHRFIENLLAKPGMEIRLAVLSDDEDIVLGFSAIREDVLDYVYVNKEYRNLGMAKRLCPKEITTISHITYAAMNIWQHNEKYKELKFNPFA